jgi:tape measure domain-containing protein
MRGDRTFTTYMNVEVGKGNQRALTSFERQANDSLRRVQQTAQRAGAVATGIMPATGSPARIQMLAAAERQRAQALQGVARASRTADAAAHRHAGAMMRESNAARAAATNTSRLERSLRLASVAANVAQGPLGPIAGRLSAMATAVRELTGFRFGLVGIGAAAAGYARFASRAQDLIARLRPLYETQVQVNAAFKDAQAIADSARVGIEPVIDLYARLTLAGREAGLSQQRISRLTEIASKAAKLSGGTAVSQEAGLYQFAQGIGSGTLAGDELRSVRENTLRLAKAIADGLDVPIAKLKALGKAGALTPQVIADALEKEAARIDAEMAKLPVTISSATTKLSNAFVDLVTKTEQATGVAGAFGNVINLVAENLSGLVHALGLLALAYAGLRTGRMITETNARITAWQAERREILNNANQAKTTAATQRQASTTRIVALRQERAALQQQIVAEQALANEKRRAALDTARFLKANAIYTPGMGGLNQFAGYTRAVNEARIAQDNLAASKNRLRNVNKALTGQFGVLTNSTRAYRAASVAAQRASLSFTNAVRGLWAAINPLGLALAFAIPMLIEFAFRQDAAAGSADRMAEAQNRLARVVDATTGKLLTQNAALVQNAILQAKEDRREALKAYSQKKTDLSFGGDRAIFTNISDLDPRIRAIRDQVRDRKLLATDASSRLASLTGLNPQSERARDELIRQLGGIVGLAQEVAQATAQEKLLAGQNDPETLRRAFGNFTGQNIDLTARAAGADEDLANKRNKRTKATDEAAKAERELQRIQDRTDKRTDILARYDEEPRALDKAARDARELNQLVGKAMNGLAEISKNNPLGKGIYTAEMAAADAARISYGVRRPIREAIDEQRRGLEISRLRLDGYENEAEALEQALRLQDQIGRVSEDELETLLTNIERQQQINDLLASRERQVSQILDVAQQTRDAFEDMLVGLGKNPLKSIKGFVNSVFDNYARIQARQLTEKLFAGADEKLRELVRGSNGVDRAADILAANVKSAADSMPPLAAANDNLASATENAAARINAAADSITTGGSIGGLAPSSSLARATETASKAADAISSVTKTVAGSKDGGILGALGALAAGVAKSIGSKRGGSGIEGLGEGAGGSEDNVIVVRGQRVPRKRGEATGPIPSGTLAYNAVFERLGEKLDKVFKSGTFFSGVGKGVGRALQGAAQGQLASGVVGMLGLKQSKTGAAIGGAIGNLILPGIGGFIGGALGGTIGGLFKKTKSGSSTIAFGADGAMAGAATGNNAAYRTNASNLAGSVADRLNQIATTLDATISGGSGSISIGQRKDKFTVDTTGRNRTKGSGVLKFSSEEEAAQYAFQQMLQRVVLGGISQASQNIIRAGSKNIDLAIQKALAIESIPKRLLEKTDPVRFAVQQLNDEFTKLISYLKEGGATTEQFADAQKLYELERADAIERATQQASAAIQAYLDEITGGAGSPFNKRTTYENAANKLNSFRADIDAGKRVNESDLLAAARNFQDASSALFGSSQAFFSDFDSMFALLTKARDNITAGASDSPLPGSPFANDAEVARILGTQVDATNSQTDILAGKLDQLIDLIGGNAGYVPSLGSGAIAALPGFGGQASTGRLLNAA